MFLVRHTTVLIAFGQNNHYVDKVNSIVAVFLCGFFFRNKSTLVFGWIFRILTNVISPLLMSSYLSLFLFSSDTDIFRFFGAVGALHAFRMVSLDFAGAELTFFAQKFGSDV